MENEMLENIIKYINKKTDISEIAKELNLKEYEVYGLVQVLINNGYLYEIVDGKVVKINKPRKSEDVYQVTNTNDTLRLLLVSDTHLCSKYDRLDILRYLYDKADERKVNYVLHSGDFTDGRSNRPEHIYELKELSYEGQVEYCVEKYPKSEIPTLLISGNHDDWWYKSNGSDIVKAVAKQRKDLLYLGTDVADVKIGKLKVHLFHGKGAQAYAKSYKAQKYLDAMHDEEKIPHILQMGHIHQAFFYQQGKTSVFQTGCLEDQTPFCRSMGLENEKSCWWVTVHMDDKGNPALVEQELEMFGPRKVKRR